MHALHTFADAGDFGVTLTVTDSAGASTVVMQTLHVGKWALVPGDSGEGRP